MTPHACTIIARNYLAAARVLARSFAAHHPAGTFTTLVIDDRHGEVDGQIEPFEVLRPADLDLDPAEVNRMAAIYDVMELATALKPWLLEQLLGRWSKEAIYLDPDIVIYSPLDEVTEMAAQAEVVLTPHVTKPMARDGLTVDETHILASGSFNLGFIAVGGRSPDFLEFWKERLRRECVVEPLSMRFVDQRWLDFAPGLFDVRILRDPGYNVAYWNLDQRELAWEADHYSVDDRPLRFFHFSGYNPSVPEILSRHQGEHPRILLSERPTLARICAEYAESLRAEGYERAVTTRYGYSRLDDGLNLDRPMRVAYRQALRDAEEDGGPIPPNPFEGATAFLDWLNASATDHRLTRYTASLWANSLELRERFPSAEFRDHRAFLEWCTKESLAGRIDYRLVPETLVPRADLAHRSDAAEAPAIFRPGFRIAFESDTVVNADPLYRATVMALEASRIRYSVATELGALHEPTKLTEPPLNVNLLGVEPSALSEFVWRMGPEFFSDRYTVGLWDWAFEEFPDDLASAFEHVDEIWATSSFGHEAIASVLGKKPVFTFPVPVTRPALDQDLDRDELGLPPGPVFFSSFDMASGFERVNPLGLLKAFERAFGSRAETYLVIEIENGESNVAKLEHLRLEALRCPGVVLRDVESGSSPSAKLLGASDCYVSLHRCDGFDWRLAEAMSLGKPVIATAYAGSRDLLAEVRSYPVPYADGIVPSGCAPYIKGARWAQPDLDACAENMRRVVEAPEQAEVVGMRGRAFIEQRRSPQCAARFIQDRFTAAQLEIAERFWILS